MYEMRLKHAILITIILFFATLTVGWVGSNQNPSMGENLMKLFEKEVAGQMTGDNPNDMAVKLFANNLEACILLFLGGASFGILTLFIMSLNGIVIGAILELVHEQHSGVFVAAAILPHGIFEIPAFILAGALGIMLSHSLVDEYYGKGDAAAEAQRLARNFVLMVIPLLAVAALVEAFITPQVIQLVV